MSLRCIFGHVPVFDWSSIREGGRLRTKCEVCDKRLSTGFEEVAGTGHHITEPGDPARHRLSRRAL